MSQGDLFDTNIYAGNTQPGAADLQGKNLDVRTLAISTDDTGKKNIEYVAIEAHAGYTNGYGDLDYISELPKFRLPFLPLDGTYRAFKIKGDSMNPLPSGSVVIGENVRDWKTLKSGDTYVIITRNDGIVYKRVTNLLQQGESVLLLNSDNPDYDSYTINASEIVEVWKARTFIIDNPYP